MFGKKPSHAGRGFGPGEFSELSAAFVQLISGMFHSPEPMRLWPLMENRNEMLGKFWQAAAEDYGPQAAAWRPDRLSVEMMREDNFLIGLMLLPTMQGSIGFTAGVWIIGPADPQNRESLISAPARFFAMAEQVGKAPDARIYEATPNGLVETGSLAVADVGLFLDTLVERCIKGQVVTTVKSGDPNMAAAMEAATAQVPYFIDVLENYPAVQEYSVKVKVEDAGEAEYFWLENTRWEGGLFHGTLGNDPTRVRNVAYGQSMSVAPDQVRDWYYFWEGKMRGNYTLRAGLPYMDPAQAAKLSAILDEA